MDKVTAAEDGDLGSPRAGRFPQGSRSRSSPAGSPRPPYRAGLGAHDARVGGVDPLSRRSGSGRTSQVGAEMPGARRVRAPVLDPEPTMRVSADGTVFVGLPGGGAVEVATVPSLDVVRHAGPRRAFLSPSSGRHGLFVAVIEGVPPPVADLFFTTAQDSLARGNLSAPGALESAVRAGCAAVWDVATRRASLNPFGFSVVLIEHLPMPMAYIAQLPPCQLYVVNGSGIRAIPEVPTGRAVATTRSSGDRRWEVEIESVRVPLEDDTRLVLGDASFPAILEDPSRLEAIATRSVTLAAGRLAAIIGAGGRPGGPSREAVVVRIVPVRMSSSTRLSGASASVRGFLGAVVGLSQRVRSLWAVPDLGSVALAPDYRRTNPGLRGTRNQSGRDNAEALHSGTPTSDQAQVDAGGWPPVGDRRAGDPRAAESMARLGGSAPPARPGREVHWLQEDRTVASVDATLPYGRVMLIPTTRSGVPLASARAAQAWSPSTWWQALRTPDLFLPGGAREMRRRSRRNIGLAISAVLIVGALSWGRTQAMLRTAADTVAPAATSTAVVPPTVTAVPLAGRTVAQAKTRFVSMAGPSNVVPGAVAATAVLRVLDESGEIVSVRLTSQDAQRDPIPARPTPVPAARTFVPTGLFALGGALVPRDDGTLLFEASGMVFVLPASGQAPRVLRIKSTEVWAAPRAVVVYGPSMYVFDAGAGAGSQVWRHPLTSGAQYEADAVPWLAAGQSPDLSTVSDIAADGSFWAALRNGTILKLAAGKATTIALKNSSASLGPLGAIYTDQGTTSVYVIDDGNRRLIRFTKEGVWTGAVETVLGPDEESRGLWIDEAGRRAVVATTRRVAIVPLPM